MRRCLCEVQGSQPPSLVCHCTWIAFLLIFITSAGVTVSGQGDHQHQTLVFVNATFSGSSYEYKVNINQNFLVNDPLLIARCNNTEDESAAVSYTLSSSLPDAPEYFNIDPANGRVTLTVDSLTLVNDTWYNSFIHCSSGGGGGTTVTALLKVHYQLQNQYPPVFAIKHQIQLTYIENNNISGQNNIIYDFNATDQDRGICSAISYVITSRNRDLFQINSTTGILSFLTPLDYELESQHTITVQATNPQCLTSDFLLPVRGIDIRVNETNDTPPRFSKSVYRTNVTENEEVHRFILNVSCSDPDLGSRIFYLLQSNVSHLFSIDHFSGRISVDQAIDYERNPSFSFLVFCRDEDSDPKQEVNATVIVSIIPINEHRPHFESRTLLVIFSDTTPLDTIIAAPDGYISNALKYYTVTDQDRGLDHDEIKFEITSIDEAYESSFDLDGRSGALRLVGNIIPPSCRTLNEQILAKITLEMTACDIEDKSSCEVLSVILYVNKSNCEDYISKLPSVVNVSELVLTGSTILSLPCNISLLSRLENSAFLLNRENRSVILVEPLDYETKKQHLLQLVCEGNESFEIAIGVTPENEYPPKFANNSIFIVQISSSTPSNLPWVITRLNATDMDQGRGGNLSYYLTEPSHYFDISTSGQLIMIENLPSTETVFRLMAGVSDGTYSDNATIVVIQPREENSSNGKETQVAVMAFVFSATLALLLVLLLVSWVFISYLCCQQRNKYKKKDYGLNRVNRDRQNIDVYHFDITDGQPPEARTSSSYESDGAFKCNSLFRSSVPFRSQQEEPEYETIFCKEQHNIPPRHNNKGVSHSDASPRNSFDCYVSMRNTSEVLNEEPKLDNGGYTDLPVPISNESKNTKEETLTLTAARRTVMTNPGAGATEDMETSLEFGGALESSLEFGTRNGISLDFAGPSRLGTLGGSMPRTPRSGNFDMIAETGGLQLESPSI